MEESRKRSPPKVTTPKISHELFCTVPPKRTLEPVRKNAPSNAASSDRMETDPPPVDEIFKTDKYLNAVQMEVCMSATKLARAVVETNLFIFNHCQFSMHPTGTLAGRRKHDLLECNGIPIWLYLGICYCGPKGTIEGSRPRQYSRSEAQANSLWRQSWGRMAGNRTIQTGSSRDSKCFESRVSPTSNDSCHCTAPTWWWLEAPATVSPLLFRYTGIPLKVPPKRNAFGTECKSISQSHDTEFRAPNLSPPVLPFHFFPGKWICTGSHGYLVFSISLMHMFTVYVTLLAACSSHILLILGAQVDVLLKVNSWNFALLPVKSPPECMQHHALGRTSPTVHRGMFHYEKLSANKNTIDSAYKKIAQALQNFSNTVQCIQSQYWHPKLQQEINGSRWMLWCGNAPYPCSHCSISIVLANVNAQKPAQAIQQNAYNITSLLYKNIVCIIQSTDHHDIDQATEIVIPLYNWKRH